MDLESQLSESDKRSSLPASAAATASMASDTAEAEVGYPATETSGPTWSFDHLPANEANIRGGGCTPSSLCDKPRPETQVDEDHPNRDTTLRIEQKEQSWAHESAQEEEEPAEHKSWPGWAELENDPEIFTILLQEWGVPDVAVNEVLDIAELIAANPSEILGLIFLSKYVPPDQSGTLASALYPNTNGDGNKADPVKPWFANQISKFSCGTVALLNILMNAQDMRLSETLSTFRQDTNHLNAKYRGIALDNHTHFRDIHNSFSTKLDRMIVDVLVKDEAQKWKQRKAAQARATAQRAGGATKKRKKGSRAPFTQRRKKAAAVDEEDENGFHFVAYVQAHESVWKLDGMQAHPRLVGHVSAEQTWLNVAAENMLQKMQEALASSQECSLMSVTKTNTPAGQEMPQREARRLEKERKQEDWAPFIECMLRLHAEKGDLQEMLGL